MTDQTAFMETLRLVEEIARTTEGVLTREEIQIYFKDMELTKEQQELVYEYLLNPKNYQEAAQQEPEEDNEPDSGRVQEPEPQGRDKKKHIKGKPKVSAHFQLYLDEIKELPLLSAEEEQVLYQRLLQGDDAVTQTIANQWLLRVIDLVEEYVSEHVLLEDLIQEGNIGLLMGLKSLTKGETGQDTERYLGGCIKQAVEAYLEEETGDGSQESSILAKAALIQEAAKFLANDKGTIPTMLE